MSSPNSTNGPQTLRRANDVINLKTFRPPALLFDEFWREGELAMLFGEANAGKSLLSVQIADALARGKPINGFQMQRGRRNVLYVDLVLTGDQWTMRYSRTTAKNGRRAYKFSQQLYHECPPENVKLTDWLRGVVKANKIDVVVIDDLSFVSQSDDGTRETLEMMRELRRMTRAKRISVLVLADSYTWAIKRGIAERDLRRNRVLCAFADSVFALEAVDNTDRRSLIQTRSQAGEAVWTTRNPARLNVAARDDGSVGFELEAPTPEQCKLIVKIKELHDEGRSFREIADELEMSKSTVARLCARWTPAMQRQETADGRREQEDFPGCTEYDKALEDPRFAVLYDNEGKWTEPTTYKERLLEHEYELVDDARFHAEIVYEDTGRTPRLADDKKYKEFLECMAAGGDPLAEVGSFSAQPQGQGGENLSSPPYEGGVAAASADGVVLSLGGELSGVSSQAKNHPAAKAAPLLGKEGSFEDHALTRGIDAYGKEIFTEKLLDNGKPKVWYKRDSRGRLEQYVRSNLGINIRLAPPEIAQTIASAFC